MPTRSRISSFLAQPRRRPLSAGIAALIIVALALPVLAADPSASPSAGASAATSASPSESVQPSARAVPSVAAPSATPKAIASGQPEAIDDDDEDGGKPDKANKGAKTPEVAITLRGPVAMATDAKGRQTFSMTTGGKTYELEDGPPWFWGANNPLAKFAGKTVTIAGETRAGSTEVDVLSVDGAAIRAPGKPPWAGGWKVVGEKHPGWSQEKADRFKAKFGDCFPPGHCKGAEPAPDEIPRGD